MCSFMRNLFKMLRNLVIKFPKSKEEDGSISEGIVVHFYHDYNVQKKCFSVLAFGKTFIAEELCTQACRYVGIGPLARQMFSLITDDHCHWLTPDREILCSKSKSHRYILRIRFLPPCEDHKFVTLHETDETAFNYFYSQCRDDFIHDRFQYNGKAEELQQTILGIGLLDLIRYGKGIGAELSELKKLKPQYFIPVSVLNGSLANAVLVNYRLKQGFMQYLQKWHQKYLTYNKFEMQKLFLQHMISLISNYACETFQCVAGGEIVEVKPHGKEKQGINYIVNGVGNLVPIGDVIAINIDIEPEGHVQLSHKNGPPLLPHFGKRDVAASFVALIDGYYRLQENFYYALCTSLQIRSVQLLKSLVRCHGPFPSAALQTVKRILHKKIKDKGSEYNYLLFQSGEEYNKYKLLYYDCDGPELHSELFDIQPLDDVGRYQLSGPRITEEQPSFDSIPDLLRHYRTSQSVVKMRSGIPTSEEVGSWLYPCRKTRKVEEKAAALAANPTAASCPQVFTGLKTGNLIDRGIFSNVFDGCWLDDAKQQQYLNCSFAMKQLDPAKISEFLQDFLDAADRASSWQNSNIVALYGVSLSRPVSLLLELSPVGCLRKYLHANVQTVTSMQLCLAAEQLAMALMYLQEVVKSVHGNIRCRNILVFQSGNEIRVKLADPGLILAYNRAPGGISHDINKERLPWIAPELRSNLSAMTLYSDIFAVGTTLCEIFTLGKWPPDDSFLSIDQLGDRLCDRPLICPLDVYTTICQCWDSDPIKRPQARSLVRDIRSVYPYEVAIPSLSNSVQTTGASEMNRQNDFNSNIAHQQAAQDKQMRGVELPISIDLNTWSGHNLLNSPTSSASTASSSVWDSQICLIKKSPHSNDHHGNGLRGNINQWAMNNFNNGAFSNPLAVAAFGGHFERFENCIAKENIHMDMTKALGSGHYGTVYQGQLTTSRDVRQPIAIKCLNANHRQQLTREFVDEINIMQDLDHPNVVKILGKCFDYNNDLSLLLVMEFVANGSLLEYLRKNSTTLDRDKLIGFAQDIAEGMNYLHHKDVIHRDLAARNILVTGDFRLKVSDFGLSRLLTNSDYYRASPQKAIPAPWCSLESLERRTFTKRSDVWSYGISLWEIHSLGDQPNQCKDPNGLLLLLQKGDRLKRPRCAGEKMYQLMMDCWKKEPLERPLFDQIIQQLISIKANNI